MGSSGSASDSTRQDVRGVFSQLDEPCTPLTTAEVAEDLEFTEAATREHLEELAERGAVQTRQVGQQTRIWWNGEGRAGYNGDQGDLEEYDAFVSAVQDYAIFMLDPEGVVVSWNDGAERIKGYDATDIVGEHFSEFYTEDDIDAGVPERNLETARVEGRVEDVGWRVRQDGTEFCADVVITAIRDDDGALRGFTKVTRDMTEQREYEQQLRRRRDVTEQILETVPVSIAVINSDGEFVRANEQALDRLDVEESDLSAHGPDAWELRDAHGEVVPVDERPWTRVLETGEQVRSYQCQVDFPSLGRRWLSVDAAPIESGDHDEQVVVSVDDITELKQRERQLQQRKAELETELGEVLGRISDAFYALDEEWCFTHLNDRAAEIMQHSREELLDTEIWEILHEPSVDLFREQFGTAMDTQEPRSFEMYADDVDAWLEFNAYPSETGLSVYFRDVSVRKARERELKRYETLFKESTDVNAVLNPDGTFEYLPPSVKNVLGYEPEELTGEVAFEYVHPDDREKIAGEFARLVEDPEFEPTNEFRYRHADGSWIWLESVGRNLLDDPSIEGIVAYTRDVTERRKREEELREREQRLERYETIVESVNDGVYVVDDEAHFTMVNEAYATMLGYDPEELVGSHTSLVVDDDVSERAQELEAVAAASHEGMPTMEAEMKTADGRRVPAEANFAMLPGDDGTWHRVGVVRDVSERRERERQIEESERRYRTLVENFPHGVVALFDENLEYTAVGGELMEVTGVEPAERIGKSVYDIYPEHIVEEVEPYFEAALEGETSDFEIAFHDRDLYAHTLPVKDADDETFAGMLVVEDVTEQREYERKLEESNERLEQFAYAASHDLQEPLRMVSSYLQLIERRYGDEFDDDGQEFLEFAVDGADRMRKMIDALLQYSRVDTRGDPFEPVDLDDVLADTRENLRVKIDESQAEITADSLPRVEGDPGQLRQLFQNLLDNAIEYSGDEPPEVHVGAERLDDRWAISVRDEGIGIDPDDTERVFEVFQSLHSQEEFGGTGIGLALCQRIVERHGGDIQVDSEPGVGTTFTFTLAAVGDDDE